MPPYLRKSHFYIGKNDIITLFCFCQRKAVKFLEKPLTFWYTDGGGMTVESKSYVVIDIEGEYAYLQDTENPSAEALFIALALLPPGTDVNTRLHYEMLSYTIVE